METEDDLHTSLSLLGAVADSTNQRAWKTFVERYKPLLEHRCRRWGLQAADVEDVCGDILAKLTEAMARFRYDPAGGFRAWLRKVADNSVRSSWRSLARRPAARGSGDTGVQQALEQVAADADIATELTEAMAGDMKRAHALSERVRAKVQPHTWQAFWLTTVGGEPAAEAARKLGMSTARVYVAKSRVIKLLQAEGAGLRSAAQPHDEVQP
jgi:RNA polymerase sigma-70 factor (ECF subfamily)